MNNLEIVNNAETNISSVEILKPVENLNTIKLAFNEIDNIKNALLDFKDIANIKWKKYINKRWYRKLAIAFSISTEIISEKRIEKWNHIIYDFSIRAISPIGRYMDSSASCCSEERDFTHIENDVRATAQTRATNRAISDLIWLWEISYEEIHDTWYQNYSYENSNKDDSVEVVSDNEMITQKQRRLLIKLVENKYQEEQTRNQLYKQIDSLSKEKARITIKWLLEEWIAI